MNEDQPEPLEEQFSSLLAACDEALAAGTPPRLLAEARDAPELRDRLQRGLACLQRLQRLRPPRPAAGSPSAADSAPPAGPPGSTDRNLLFGVLALQADLIDQARFVEACTLWATRKHVPLADLLVERGWLSTADKADVERLLARKLQKHAGDVQASLAEVADDAVRQALSSLEDAAVHQSLTDLPPSAGSDPARTVTYTPEPGQRYTLTRLHATGGIGRVWVAHDSDLGREVALKELRPERADNSRLWARFLHEAQITGQLEHPGIVPVYELARRPDDQQPFYTMRFVKGRTLTEAVQAYHQKRAAGRVGPLELIALLNAFVAVCQAVAYAHSRGVIHRDLKGQNVVVGDFGEVIVLDWGFAKVLGRADESAEAAPVVLAQEADVYQTVQGQVVGTPAYMAPEQAAGRLDLIDRRTDVYGLGALLFEILTGRPVFAGSEVPEVLRQVREEEPPRPRQVWAGVPRALEAVCLKALAKKPAARYASAAELAREVQHWLADEPPVAYREPVAARLGRWARRHKPLVAGLAVLLLAAAASTVAIRDERARTAWEQEKAVVEREAKDRMEGTNYVKLIGLAAQAVAGRHVALADELLEECPARLRQWEWHYLQRRLDLCVLTLRGQGSPVAGVVYSPDGRYLAGATGELADPKIPGEVKVWEAATGKEVRRLPAHQGWIQRLAYSPDGQRLASGGFHDRTVRVWDATTGQPIHTLVGHTKAIISVASSPTRPHLASSSWDRTVRVWDVTTGQLIHTLNGPTNELGSVMFDPDGRRLAVADYGGNVWVWDTLTWKLLTCFPAHTGAAGHVAFSPDGQRLASCGQHDWTVRVWDTTAWTELRALRGHKQQLGGITFSPDGRRLASTSWDGTLRVWDPESGQLLRTFHRQGDRAPGVAFSPDGRYLAASGADHTVKIFAVTDLDKHTGPEALTLRGHTSDATSVAFSPDGQRFATGGADQTVVVWDRATGQKVCTCRGHAGEVLAVVFPAEGLASAAADGTVKVWEAATGREVRSVGLGVSPVRRAAFSAGGRHLATAGDDQVVRLWEATTGQALHTLGGHKDVLHRLAFSPDGQRLASADAAGIVKLWDTATGQALLTLRAGASVVRCVGFSPDGRRLAWAGADATVKVWDIPATLLSWPGDREVEVEALTLLGHTGVITSLAFSPDSQRLVSAGADQAVKVWDTRTGEEVLTLGGHKTLTHDLAFSPDGRLLAAAGAEGTVTVWNGTPVAGEPGRATAGK
jgi:WD40 repeat protein/tRNA A-37 threonylcarbamoyl transferase component Bud32